MTLDHSHTKVILIGNSVYPEWPEGDIKNIQVNLDEFQEVLCDPGMIGIKNPENILVIANKGKVKIQVSVNNFISNCKPEDTLIIYYAGHGLIDINDVKELYLATGDTMMADKQSTCIPSAELKKSLIKCRASNKIMILDCCYAGLLPGLQGDTDSIRTNHWIDTQGVFLMMSSDKDTPSRFDPNDSTIPTFFTQRVIETIKVGANVNKEIFTLDDFFDAMNDGWNLDIAPRPIKLSLKEIGSFPFCFNHYKAKQLLATPENPDLIRWKEIAADENTTIDTLQEFLEKVKDKQVQNDALDYWEKLLEDYRLLADASAKETFTALKDFIKNCNPLPPVNKAAVKKMKNISDQNITSDNRNPRRAVRATSADISSSAAFNPNVKVETNFVSPPIFNKKEEGGDK